jgi:dihydrolipoamide dehydrogenase
MTREVDVAIIGAGSAGLYALSQVKHAGKSFVLIDGGELGTTCARVGCMPSKVAIQVAEDFHHRKMFPREGIDGGDELSVDGEEAMEYIQDLRDHFVDQVLTTSTDEMIEEFIEGYARFISPNEIEVNDEIISAKKFVIATGSSPIVPEAWKAFGDKIITTDEVFEMETLPESMAVIGMGVIGLELGQAFNRMGVSVTGIDQMEQLAGISDPDINKTLLDIMRREFPVWLGHQAEIAEADDKLLVSAGDQSVVVEKVLVSIGRRSNLAALHLEAAGITVGESGIPEYDPQTMRIGDSNCYIAGDVNGIRPILHEAGDEGRIAGHNAAAESDEKIERKVPLAITFCEPNLVQVGKTMAELEDSDYVVGSMKVAGLGRALIMTRNKGLIHLYCDKEDGKLLGASMCVVRGDSLGHLLAWSIEMGLTVFDMLKMPFYHPVMEEALQAALRDAAHQITAQHKLPWDLKWAE